MNDFEQIVYDIDKDGQKQLMELLKKYKKNQKDLTEQVAAIILENQDESGAIVLSPTLTMEVREAVTENLNEMQQTEQEFMEKALATAYTDAAKQTAKVIGLKASFDLVREEMVQRAINTPIDGKNFSERIWENTDDLANRIYNDVLKCIKTGKRPNHIIKQIKDDYGTSAYNAKRLFHTELAKVVCDAQMQIYRDSGVVDKVMWMATLENNTCERCAELDGKLFDLDNAPMPPLHPNCRCCHVPIVDGEIPTKRAVTNGKDNIDYMTYSEWSKRGEKK